MNDRAPLEDERSATIENIENLLKLGGYDIEVNGVWKLDEKPAVLQFQQDYNGGAFHIGVPEVKLEEDGIPGKTTQGALFDMFGGHEDMEWKKPN